MISAGDDAISMADGLIAYLSTTAIAVPSVMQSMIFMFADLPNIDNSINQLGVGINSTNNLATSLEEQINSINVNLTILNNLTNELSSIESRTTGVVEKFGILNANLDILSNDTYGDVFAEVTHVETLVNHSFTKTIIDLIHAKHIVQNVEHQINKAKKSEDMRKLGFDAAYATLLATCVIVVIGFILKSSVPFHVTAGFGFVLSLLFWLSGSTFLTLGLALHDGCPVFDPIVRTIGKDPKIHAAINNCIAGNATLFSSLHINETINFTTIFGFEPRFVDFTTFVAGFSQNFSEIDSYLTDVRALEGYNLAGTAANITTDTFNWNENYVYDGLNALNQETLPYGYAYSLQNYSQLNLNDFPADKQSQINTTKVTLDNLVLKNSTVYDDVAKTKQQLYAAQESLTTMVYKNSGYIALYQNYSVVNFAASNVNSAIQIVQLMRILLDSFNTLGNCSFVGPPYSKILNTLCYDIRPTSNILVGSHYLIGVSIIAIIIIAQVLAVRVPHPKKTFEYGEKTYIFLKPKKEKKYMYY
jgi:hypothetical protein